ncbi:MAG: Endoglucanase precursor, partial [Myxococcaceae bacterium]|nr:Endoglucanase precursor [Myxococcaceae bacterium]
NWSDYGWADHDAKGPGPVKIHFHKNAGWILKARDETAVAKRFGAVVFRIKAPADFGDFLEVKLSNDGADHTPVKVTAAHQVALPDGWVQVVIPLRTLTPHYEAFDRIRFKAIKSVADTEVLLDFIGFTAPSATPEAPIPWPTKDAKLVVRCDRPTTPISPYIYGTAAATPPEELRVPARRWGGNTATRFNWQLGNVWNTGSDYFFENVKGSDDRSFEAFMKDQPGSPPAFRAITVPIIGWIAKDSEAYSFSVKKLGPQKEVDSDHPDRGNGERPDGTEIPPPDPTTTSIAASPELIAAWVSSIKKADEARGAPVVREYILDNEPALWNSTHRDVHPQPVSYDELLDRTIRYGAAVRAADPNAVIAGPAEWGWSNYFFSAKDAKGGYKNKPDRLAHGDVPLLDWYLQKLKEHEQKTGQKVLDVVDLHFYPQAKNVFGNHGGGDTDPDTAALRFRSTRALWDSTYVDESWIKEAINLIPRLKEIIAKNYPGRGISIGEWNFGAEAHITGALAMAEALGRFAQGGIHSAYHWEPIKKGTPAYWTYRAFRNYDGKGGAFLDNYVTSEAPEGTSLHVSRDATGTKLVIVAMNFDGGNAANMAIDTSSCGTITARKTFTYAGEPEGLAEQKPGAANAPKSVAENIQPRSIAVFELTLTK